MTVKMLATHKQYSPNMIVTLDSALEAYFVDQGNATYDLTGGVPYVAPVVPNQLVSARLSVDPAGNVDGIAGPDGTVIALGGTEGGAVASVNMKVGTVQLTAEDIGALPAPYAIGAVHFDGANTALVNPSLVCTDNGDLSFSFWCNIPEVVNPGVALWTVDAPNEYSTFWQLSPGTLGKGDMAFSNAGGGTTFRVQYDGVAAYTWHHVIGSVKTNISGSPKVGALYIDGVDNTPVLLGGSSLPFAIACNGKPFHLGDDSYGGGAVMNLADFWFAPGQSLLDETGAIPAATIRKFADAHNNPVPLGANGELPTGTAPAIYLSCSPQDVASVFVANRGWGGAFSLVGSLTKAESNPPINMAAGMDNPMTAAGDLIVGGSSGSATRLANPGAGTFTLKSIDGVLTWAA